MAYSVSPTFFEASVGGKNSENFSTRMPTALATEKWPSSCSDHQQGEARERQEPAHSAGTASVSSRARSRASASAA